MRSAHLLVVVPEAERSEAVRNPYPQVVIMDSGLAASLRPGMTTEVTQRIPLHRSHHLSISIALLLATRYSLLATRYSLLATRYSLSSPSHRPAARNPSPPTA